MVHIKRVELYHFKSFGGTVKIPFLPGFTVISGPNGSGKSNILDALLFCLGLASSRGMRAERLPDLVNHKHTNNGRTAETSVSVTFDLSTVSSESSPKKHEGETANSDRGEVTSSLPTTNNEWTVTRRLRVTRGGNYSSTFYINGEVCTASELHQQLNRLRIYPEGYNVVLQGDVTRIITMNSRERREIIDELAGVAEFDRKIEQTKKTLEAVREREERCKIIEQELIKTRDRLAADRVKAEKYQKLKEKIQQKQAWELVLRWRSLQQQHASLEAEISAKETEEVQLTEQLKTLETQISQASTELSQLNSRVKALGEEEQLSVASQLATQKATRHQLQQQQEELTTTSQQTQASIDRARQDIEQYQQTISQLIRDKSKLETETIPSLLNRSNQAKETLQQTKEQADAIATASEIWIQEQTALTHQISDLQKNLNPQRTEQAQLTERYNQLESKITAETQLLCATNQEITSKQQDAIDLSTQINNCEQQIQSLGQQLAAAEPELLLQQETQTRLLQEQRQKQRQLDKLEATEKAQQEAQGTYATKVIFSANLTGVCGLVAQLGQVEPRYQLALETAAGGRLGHLVVEDDRVAATGIELLKQKRAGRATFLPLNKIQPPRQIDSVVLRYAGGFIDLAVNLIDCHPRYRKIFAYVFGNTVVFATLNEARSYLGQYRIVTLEGEILEASGAMTGGSRINRSSLHFGTATASESEELEILRRRLQEIEQILVRSEQLTTQQSALVKRLTQELTEVRQQRREQGLRWEQLQREIERLTAQKEQLNRQISQNSQEIDNVRDKLQVLAAQIPILEAQLQENQQKLAALEESQTHSEWQQIQSLIKTQEAELQEREKALREAEAQLKDLSNQQQRLAEKITELKEHLESYQQQQLAISDRQTNLSDRLSEIEAKIAATESLLEQLSEKLAESKQERDRAEENFRELQNQQQKKSWELQKLQETQTERRETLQSLQQQLEEQKKELPDPLPEIPSLVTSEAEEGETNAISVENFSAQLEQLQKEIRQAQKRLQAMEPVNMLALEEYERNQLRLEELSEKLKTLAAERTELLLRIEKFTTLRLRAFKEAFDAVNENFQHIFASLSEGDGCLQLDDDNNPFNGGLNLIAHPKGKPVQRLSSMSGGEKSLTALSFIFALQRYRPSPFYAFDEVDMFLDGANVERLAKMIVKQAQQAQFIVVSLRRPMIESSERTIGVTQARGSYTQVLGIKL